VRHKAKLHHNGVLATICAWALTCDLLCSAHHRHIKRPDALDMRLDALQRPRDQAPSRELAAATPTTPDTAALQAVADRLGHTIAHGDPDQAKALLRILIADPYVSGRAEVLLPTASARRWFARRQVQWTLAGQD
jgi:hypothetical protein